MSDGWCPKSRRENPLSKRILKLDGEGDGKCDGDGDAGDTDTEVVPREDYGGGGALEPALTPRIIFRHTIVAGSQVHNLDAKKRGYFRRSYRRHRWWKWKTKYRWLYRYPAATETIWFEGLGLEFNSNCLP